MGGALVALWASWPALIAVAVVAMVATIYAFRDDIAAVFHALPEIAEFAWKAIQDRVSRRASRPVEGDLGRGSRTSPFGTSSRRSPPEALRARWRWSVSGGGSSGRFADRGMAGGGIDVQEEPGIDQGAGDPHGGQLSS